MEHITSLSVSAPKCRDIETALYDRTSVCTYVFSELCSIFQYVIKRWLHSLAENTKVIMVAYEYTYQDHEYIIRTMNTKHERCGIWLSCSKLHTRLQSVVLRHLL